jgi:CubicO group peptidase (beta-lactamase class C family)
MPYSVTKPFAALCALVLVDRGVLDLDEPLATYWPELTAPTTLRQVLAHRSGLVLLDVDAPEEAFYDWALMCRLLERQPPAWQPGAEHGESALLYGHLVGEVVRRVDGRTLGTFLREEICGPRGLDFHVGLAEGDLDRVADLTGYAPGYLHTVMEGGPLRRRAISNPPGVLDPAVVNAARWRRSEVPAVNGHGTARSVAGLYVALQRGRVLTADLLADATRPQGTGPDRVMGGDRSWGLGVDVDDDGYGMGGLGGSFGWWSERGQYAFAFMSGHIGDPDRGDRLESTVRAVLGLPPV